MRSGGYRPLAAVLLTCPALFPSLSDAAVRCERPHPERVLQGTQPYKAREFKYESRVAETKDPAIYRYFYCVENNDGFSIDVEWLRSDYKKYFDHTVPPSQERQSSRDYSGRFESALRDLKYGADLDRNTATIVPETIFNVKSETTTAAPENTDNTDDTNGAIRALHDDALLKSYIETEGPVDLRSNATFDVVSTELRREMREKTFDGYAEKQYDPVEEFLVITVNFISRLDYDERPVVTHLFLIEPEFVDDDTMNAKLFNEALSIVVIGEDGSEIFGGKERARIKTVGELSRRMLLVRPPVVGKEATVALVDDELGLELGSMLLTYWSEE